MRDAGYSAAFYGKWHLGDLKNLHGGNKKWPISHPGQPGFDKWWATERSGSTCSLNCECFPHSKCTLGHYTKRPACINYHSNKTANTIPSWNGPITGDD